MLASTTIQTGNNSKRINTKYCVELDERTYRKPHKWNCRNKNQIICSMIKFVQQFAGRTNSRQHIKSNACVSSIIILEETLHETQNTLDKCASPTKMNRLLLPINWGTRIVLYLIYLLTNFKSTNLNTSTNHWFWHGYNMFYMALQLFKKASKSMMVRLKPFKFQFKSFISLNKDFLFR